MIGTKVDKGRSRDTDHHSFVTRSWLPRFLNISLEDVKKLFTAITVGFHYHSNLGEPRSISSSSMCPTLNVGDFILMEKVRLCEVLLLIDNYEIL